MDISVRLSLVLIAILSFDLLANHLMTLFPKDGRSFMVHYGL